MKPGDQHKGLTNPFDEAKISPFTAIEIATLQARLDQQLGPEFISSRPGAGGKKIHYLQADKCINLANEVFGFNGWSSTVKTIELDFLDQSKEGKWSIGLSVTVRVTLKDGTYHEDIGYGTMENGKNKAQVFEKAKKEGTTDALKRALRNFGNVLGNCLYDKEYLAKVVKMRVPPPRFEERKLHRHGEFAHQIKKESLVGPGNTNFSDVSPRDPLVLAPPSEEKQQESPETFDEYGGDEFEELGIFGSGGDLDDLMPDEVAVDINDDSIKGPSPQKITGGQQTSNNINQSAPQINHQNIQTPQPQRVQQVSRNTIAQPQPPQQPQQPRQPQHQQNQTHVPPANQHQPMQRLQSNPPQVPRAPTPQGGFNGTSTPVRAQPQTNTNFRNVQQGINQRGQPPQQQPQQLSPSVPIITAPQLNGGPETPKNPPPQNPPVGFFSGRAVIDSDGENKLIPDQALAFNPHHQTSIPRSHGIDHSKSSPIPRKVLSGPQGPAGGPYVRPNFENPSLNMNRQIGMPPQTRGAGSFRQPGPAAAGVKRPADITNTGNNPRPTLGDASGTNLNKQTTSFGNETKRQARMS